MRKIELVSSQFPSGVAWILNFLLEINILVYRGDNIASTWDYNKKNKFYSLNKKDEVLKQWIPVLSEKEKFYFKDDISIRWTHEFPTKNNLEGKTILLVRDGRDAIYSQYKREVKGESFTEMLKGFCPPFGLNPADTWALMNLMWSNSVQKDNLFVIKFEDIKTDPQTVLPGLLKFLGISRDPVDIQASIESSSFERAKKNEETYRATAPRTQFELVNRKGQPGEWKETYTDEQLSFFEGLPNLALKYYGYKDQTKGEKEQMKYLLDKNIGHQASSMLEKIHGIKESTSFLDQTIKQNYDFLIKALDLIKDKDGLEKEIDNSFSPSACPLCGSENIFFVGHIKKERSFATTRIFLKKQPSYWKCRTCNSGFTRNVIPEKKALELYSDNDGGRWTSADFETTKPHRLVKKISSLIEPGMKILDIGCGQGDLLDFAAAKGAETYGTELSRQGKTLSEKKGHVIYESVERLSRDLKFDIIFAFDLVEHLYNAVSFLNWCSQVLSEKGRLIILTGNPDCLSAKIAKNNWWYVSFPEHIIFPSEKFFRSLGNYRVEEYWPSFNSIKHNEKWILSSANSNAKVKNLLKQLMKFKFTGQPSLDKDHALIILNKKICRE